MTSTNKQSISKNAIEAGITATITDLMKPALAGLVTLSAAPGIAGVTGALIAGIFTSLFESTNEVDQKLQEIERDLNLMLSEPIHTALRLAQNAYKLKASNEHELKVREAKLYFAIENLEKAYSIAELQNDYQRTLFMLNIVMGLCSLRLHGGQPSAEQYFSECVPIVENRVQSLQGTIVSYKSNLKDDENKYEEVNIKAQQEPQFEPNPHYRGEPPIRPRRPRGIGGFDPIPVDYVPEPRERKTFDPEPFKKEARVLKDRIKKLKESIHDAEIELSKQQKFHTFLIYLHLVDLTGPDSIELSSPIEEHMDISAP